MKKSKALVIIVCLMIFASPHGWTADKKVKYAGTFSNLEYNQEGGDLLGMEIKIVPTKKGYQGALQIAEGGPSELMVVDVSFEKDNVKFEIPKAYSVYGGGVFEGKIDSKGIKGTLRFKETEGEKEILTRGRGYWDK
jgi:hypothetical protein